MTGVINWFLGFSPRRRLAWVIIGMILTLGLVLSARRFVLGLGAVTNLTDEFPWGFWIGFDVMSGVALAAGGFTLCCLVYVFGYHRYHSIVRATVLTAFLGYILVAVGLLFDLGKYYNIWHPIVMWNHHSVMFEVAWCVMLYSTVLFLEFLPVVLERFNQHHRFDRMLKVLKRIAIPIVLAGVILSTLHQSSLGSLFLIVPHKLHPLWYSPILPLLFFLSAIAVGPAMVIVESCLSSRLFHRGLELDILSDLARFLQVSLIVYVGVRIQDFFIRGVVDQIWAGTFESWHLIGEMAFFILPIIILAVPGLRHRRPWMPLAAFLTVGGVIYNRLNVSWTGMLRASGADYVPNWQEIAISLFLVTVGALAFYFIAKHFNIFPAIDPRHSASSSCLGVVDPDIVHHHAERNRKIDAGV